MNEWGVVIRREYLLGTNDRVGRSYMRMIDNFNSNSGGI